MWVRCGVLWVLVAGCVPDEPRVIPPYDDGVAVEGDCDLTQFVATDAVALTAIYAIEEIDGLIQIDGDLPGEAGTVVTTNRQFVDLMAELNFDTTSTLASLPYVDFTSDQVGAVWLNARKSCGIDIDLAQIFTKEDGSLVFDVSLIDTSKNCDDECETSAQALVMNLFTKDFPATVCRRISPGCSPN